MTDVVAREFIPWIRNVKNAIGMTGVVAREFIPWIRNVALLILKYE